MFSQSNISGMTVITPSFSPLFASITISSSPDSSFFAFDFRPFNMNDVNFAIGAIATRSHESG